MAKEAAKAKAQEVGASYRADGSPTQDEITALIADRAQDSILLNRVWPVGAPVTTNSWLGGLPCLPPVMDWLRNAQSGLPQHFLAQVDCADLPTLNGTSPLPRDGLLLFFSDLDEKRLSESDAVLYVPKSRQSVLPRALPDDLPEIDHSGGKPATHADTPGQRHYPKWPVIPTAVKIWGDEDKAHPKTFNRDYLDQSRAAHDASLAAVMPPPVESTRLASIFPTRQRKDADGKTILAPNGKAIPYAVFDPTALPEGFPFCGAGIKAFVPVCNKRPPRPPARLQVTGPSSTRSGTTPKKSAPVAVLRRMRPTSAPALWQPLPAMRAPFWEPCRRLRPCHRTASRDCTAGCQGWSISPGTCMATSRPPCRAAFSTLPAAR
ncbi:MAG: hypothetical protein FD150_882 [Rhodobacteraceae bacterium]|nr:MAG: hypothetical protein FD150_882 [Paracoccaceae bacterium]